MYASARTHSPIAIIVNSCKEHLAKLPMREQRGEASTLFGQKLRAAASPGCCKREGNVSGSVADRYSPCDTAPRVALAESSASEAMRKDSMRKDSMQAAAEQGLLHRRIGISPLYSDTKCSQHQHSHNIKTGGLRRKCCIIPAVIDIVPVSTSSYERLHPPRYHR